MFRFGRGLAVPDVLVEQLQSLNKLAAFDGAPVGAHRVAVVRDLIEPDLLGLPSLLKDQNGGLRTDAAFADKDALRQADDCSEGVLFDQHLSEGPGAGLPPGQESFGDDDGAPSGFCKAVDHELDEKDGGLGLSGEFLPHVRVGFLVPVCAEGRIGEDRRVRCGFLGWIKQGQRVALFDILGIQASDVEVDSGHFADHSQVLDAMDA